MSKPKPTASGIQNVGFQTDLDAMVKPNPHPTFDQLRAYRRLVTVVAQSETRSCDLSRGEVLAILNAAGKRPIELAEDVDVESHEFHRSRRHY